MAVEHKYNFSHGSPVDNNNSWELWHTCEIPKESAAYEFEEWSDVELHLFPG